MIRKAKLARGVPSKEYHNAGVLLSYGTNTREAGRMLVGYVDKILKGAIPADLPIEQISRYELVVDPPRGARAGIEVPQELLFRADR